jgi:hypothetical protein
MTEFQGNILIAVVSLIVLNTAPNIFAVITGFGWFVFAMIAATRS